MTLSLVETPGRAASAPCERVEVVASPALAPAFARAARDLAIAVRALDDAECVPIRLAVEPGDEGARLLARTPDGRETSRVLRDPAALQPVALGLLATAPVPATVAPTAPPHAEPELARAPAPAQAATEPGDLPDFPRSREATRSPSSWVKVLLGLSTGLRVGVPTDVAMWDSELRADVLLRDWDLNVLLRYAPFASVSQIAPDSDAYEEIALGFGAGRELHAGNHSLDVTVSPSIVFVTMEADDPKEAQGELTQLRLNAAARYGYAFAKAWRFNLVFDVEVEPSALVKPRYADPALPPVPAATFGLRLGASSSLL